MALMSAQRRRELMADIWHKASCYDQLLAACEAVEPIVAWMAFEGPDVADDDPAARLAQLNAAIDAAQQTQENDNGQ